MEEPVVASNRVNGGRSDASQAAICLVLLRIRPWVWSNLLESTTEISFTVLLRLFAPCLDTGMMDADCEWPVGGAVRKGCCADTIRGDVGTV